MQIYANQKINISDLVFSFKISKVTFDMNLNVIEKLNILVLVDNKTDSLSSIPDLVPGKPKYTGTCLHKY